MAEGVGERLAIEVEPSVQQSRFSADVHRTLSQTPKRLHAKYFYDETGSQIFEEICGLPEYYLTRTESQILSHAIPSILGHCSPGHEFALVELGSGSSAKTRLIIDALLAVQGQLRYSPIDISETMVRHASRQLVDRFPTLRIDAKVMEYERGLELLRQRADERRLVLF